LRLRHNFPDLNSAIEGTSEQELFFSTLYNVLGIYRFGVHLNGFSNLSTSRIESIHLTVGARSKNASRSS
jgi:hypothetical protein